MGDRIKRLVKRAHNIWGYFSQYKKNKDLLRLFDSPTFKIVARFAQLSDKFAYPIKDSEEQILSSIMIVNHSIEKGLSTEPFRPGFGKQKLLELVTLCDKYISLFHNYPNRLTIALSTIEEYRTYHKKIGHELDNEISISIDVLLSKVETSPVPKETKLITKNEYFKYSNSSFDIFAESRHSIRDFSGQEIDKGLIKQAILLAQCAPSACNRQSTRVYAIYNKAKRDRIVELQNHGRGFADNASPLLIITTDLQDWRGNEEWFGGILDSGIYIQNLLYALHYLKIAAIPLNWYATINDNDALNKVIDIPKSQIVVAIIACGEPKEIFKLATSTRLSCDDILTMID